MGEVPFFSALSCRSSYHTLDFATWSFPLSAPLPPNFFLSQLSKALRLAQYVCISRCVYAHILITILFSSLVPFVGSGKARIRNRKTFLMIF